MTIPGKVVIVVLATIGILWVSRSSLRNAQHHGFYRFFAWETIIVLFSINMNDWFTDPLSLTQIFSWLFLTVSLLLIYQGVRLFRAKGKLNPDRSDPALVGIEKTTELVTAGVYRYIRHPFYSSLLFLAWGILFKHISWTGVSLTILATILLVITARKEEIENIQYFGGRYRTYMKDTKMFVPYIF